MSGGIPRRAHHMRSCLAAIAMLAALGCGSEERREPLPPGNRAAPGNSAARGNSAAPGRESRSASEVGAASHPRCTAVHDGDTITILEEGNREVRVRLLEIDAPEKAQAFGDAAREHLAGLVFGKTVAVRGSERDPYGRLLAHVHVDGVWVNRQMVADGFAWQFGRYSHSSELAEAEHSARSTHLGLWRDRHPTPPWEWRRERRGRDR